MHGYSATKYDASVVKPPKNLRRQFGHSYYQKKVRNNKCGKQPQRVIDHIRFRRSFHKVRFLAGGMKRTTGASLLDWPAVTDWS